MGKYKYLCCYILKYEMGTTGLQGLNALHPSNTVMLYKSLSLVADITHTAPLPADIAILSRLPFNRIQVEIIKMGVIYTSKCRNAIGFVALLFWSKNCKDRGMSNIYSASTTTQTAEVHDRRIEVVQQIGTSKIECAILAWLLGGCLANHHTIEMRV